MTLPRKLFHSTVPLFLCAVFALALSDNGDGTSCVGRGAGQGWTLALSPHHSVSRSLAFAGGFGNSAASKKKTIKKKRRKGGLDEELLAPTTTGSTTSNSAPSEPVLDKWGLPPPTQEDLFPPLPVGTELIPAKKQAYTLEKIQKVLSSRMKLPSLAQHFDETGVQKTGSENESPVRMQLVHESPPVLVFDNFLTDEECLHVQRVAMPDDAPSTTTSSGVDANQERQQQQQQQQQAVQVDSKTFALALSKRTSTSWFCPYKAVPTVLAKAHHLLGVDIHCMEEPQIVRYQTGQEFSWHYDEVPAAHLSNGGQRVGTFLVYLNDVARGGGTVFRDLHDPDGNPLTVQPRQGRVCLFFPADGNGRPDDRTLHKGEVAQDEKRIIQIWFHERAYQASLPPENRQEDALDAVHREAQRLGYV